MSHKDAPPETESQVACREFWQREQPHIKRAWGRAKDGSYLAEESRLLHKAWEAAALEAARDDAERYQWLRDGGLGDLPYDDHGAGPEYPHHEELDAAIDQARGKVASDEA